MLVRVLKSLLSRPGASPPSSAPGSALLREAVRLSASGDLAGAEAHCRKALALQDSSVDALHLLGTVLHAAGQESEAIGALRRARVLAPGDASIRFHLASALVAADCLDDAIAEFREAVRLQPGFAPALAGLGSVHRTLGRLDDAIACYDAALRSDAGIAQVWHNLASVRYELGQNERAVAAFDEALRLGGDSSETRYSRGLALLANGEIANGWEGYEARKQIARHGADRRFEALRPWAGENLAGRNLLILPEQGVGDEILFASMYREILARANRCVIGCSEKLEALFRRSFPDAQVCAVDRLSDPQALGPVDFRIDAGSLARRLRPALPSFPDHCGFLAADPERVARWRDRLGKLGPGLRVGICWRSANRSALRELANTALFDWGEVFSVPGVHFFSLQYDRCEEEIEAAERRFGVPIRRFADVDYRDDLDEVAALMCALDLVISSRTTVSWEAAALGVATWQLSGGGDWRGLGTTGVPWMPRLIRFRREWNQPWGQVLDALARRLAERAVRD